jgi:NaMN:DMB phosphoribosyltransferase
LLAVAALVRHAGVEAGLDLATTSFVAEDGSANVRGLAEGLAVSVTATDPGFEPGNHPATDAYLAGEAKEGVGMGGALALAERRGLPMATVEERFVAVADRLAERGGEL